MKCFKIYVDAYGDCELIGDIDQDVLGDLYARELRIEIRIEGRLVLLKPVTVQDRAHLEQKLLSEYDEEMATQRRVEAIG